MGGLSPAAILYDAAGNPVSIVEDGGVYRLSGLTKVLSSGGSQIDPATEGTLSSRASEATLAQADGRLATIDAVLDAIKDTDGVKKITDPLPAGTNEIGKVGQGTRAAAAAGWPQYIVDASGHAVGLVLDGAVYRLQADSKVAKGATALGHLEGLDVSSGVVRLKSTLYSQDGDPIAFGSVAPNPESIKNDFVKNGGATSLLVDGSTTPVVFTYDADSTKDISVLEVKLVLASNSVTFGTDYFGATSGPLPNGLLIEVTSNGNTGTVALLKQNEDFVHFASPGGFEWVVSSKDMMSALWLVGGGLKLYAGTADNIKVTVQDDIDTAGVYFKCFVKGNLLG
jgi:hypothetical protein